MDGEVHPTVLSYASYQRGDPPPEPEPFQPESVDPARAKAELGAAGHPHAVGGLIIHLYTGVMCLSYTTSP